VVFQLEKAEQNLLCRELWRRFHPAVNDMGQKPAAENQPQISKTQIRIKQGLSQSLAFLFCLDLRLSVKSAAGARAVI
jgi:hypothetical protein